MHNIIFDIMVISLTTSIYGLVRLPHVHRFRIRVLDLCYIYSYNNIDEYGKDPKNSAFEWCFEKMAKMVTMIFSFKKLKLESWVDKDVLDKLLSDPDTKEASTYLDDYELFDNYVKKFHQI